MESDILTVTEAAKYLKVSVVTLRRYLWKRKISFFRPNRKILISKSDLDAFLALNRVESFANFMEKNVI
jgi:excisionase family DNA binding protein